MADSLIAPVTDLRTIRPSVVNLPSGARVNFPAGMTKQEMADAIKRKWPELDPNNPMHKGFTGIKNDIVSGIENVPSEALQSIGQLPGAIVGGAKALATSPVRSLVNLGTGELNTIRGGLNLPSMFAQYLQKKNINFPGQQTIENAQVPDIAANAKAYLGPQQGGDQFWQGVGGFLPAAGIGAEAKGLSGVMQRALGASLPSIAQGQNPLTAAAVSALGEGLGKVGTKIKSTAKAAQNPATLFGSNLAPNKVWENYNDAAGTNTDLGSIIGSPTLRALHQNILPAIPFSGSGKSMAITKGQVEDLGSQLVQQLKPTEGAINNPNEFAHDLLMSAFENQRNIKNNLYAKENILADAENHQLDLSNFQNDVKKNKSALADTALLKNDPAFRGVLSRLGGLEIPEESAVQSPILNAQGKNIVTPVATKPVSLLEANLVKSGLYDQGNKLLQSILPADHVVGNMLLKLQDSLRNDINSSIKNTGSQALQDAHADATSNYEENYAPFLDKDMYKYISGKKDPQSMIQEIINPSTKFDKAKNIKNFQSLLPEEQRGMLGYGYLSKALDDDNNINPTELKKLIGKLGKEQLSALFPSEDLRSQVDQYSNLAKMNEEPLNVFNNPKTGARNTALIADVGMGALGAHASGLISALAHMGGVSLAAKAANNLLTSEPIREAVVKSIMKNSNRAPKALSNTSNLVKALMNTRNMAVSNNLGTQQDTSL